MTPPCSRRFSGSEGLRKHPPFDTSCVQRIQRERGFVFEATACAQIEERLNLIPVPRAFVISGQLDEIGHGMGHFRLLMDTGRSVPGRLQRSSLDVELLRPLWGRLATVQGLVHFKSNGQPRVIEAYRISAWAEGDAIFERIPDSEHGRARGSYQETIGQRPTPCRSHGALGYLAWR